MFINSKINLLVRDGKEEYKIKKDFIGDIPEWVANSWLVQMAIKSGDVVTPKAKTDKALEQADEKAEAETEGVRKNKRTK